jgi:hypothetical protein
LTEAKYGSGWGAIQVRLLGAIFLAVPLGLLYNSLSPLSAHADARLAYFAWFMVGLAAVQIARERIIHACLTESLVSIAQLDSGTGL